MDASPHVRKMGNMDSYLSENLCHDPVHGYIPFVASAKDAKQEICERQIIDHLWVQRMRQIRQLQTAWWVFPTAEHSRFQHILGVMHLASKAVEQLYPSLREVDPQTPSKPYVASLMRLAGLLHDVGHGPFGHFFDEHFLSYFDLDHERLGAHIIETQLAVELEGVRRSPEGQFSDGEILDPNQVAWLIRRPKGSDDEQKPVWLQNLRSLFCGIYTIDNMDFVLRDAFMTGLSPRSFDLPRLLHYSQFTPEGLTIHERGMHALVHFLSMKAELFRTVYFHRTVRAIDLQLQELFRESREYLFPGDPREHLDAYLDFTEFSLLTDVRQWRSSKNPKVQALGVAWFEWLQRKVPWIMVCQRNVSFEEGQSEAASVFSNVQVLKTCLKDKLPSEMRGLRFEVDLARHIHRPNTRGVTAGLNYYYDSASGKSKPLTMHGLYQRLPVSHTIVRVYAQDADAQSVFARILDELLGGTSHDDLTNM